MDMLHKISIAPPYANPRIEDSLPQIKYKKMPVIADNVMTGMDLRNRTPSKAPSPAPKKNRIIIQNHKIESICKTGKERVMLIINSTSNTLMMVCIKAVAHLPATRGKKPMDVRMISLLVRSSHSLESNIPVLTIEE